MNYYNPYFYTMPSISTPKTGLFSKLFGGNVTLGGILNGTQRVLNFANQAIPLVKQVRPMVSNAKTMFKVMNEFKKTDKPKENLTNINKNITTNDIENDEKIIIEKNNNNEGPTFFM